jgi:hypothetical protein
MNNDGSEFETQNEGEGDEMQGCITAYVAEGEMGALWSGYWLKSLYPRFS